MNNLFLIILFASLSLMMIGIVLNGRDAKQSKTRVMGYILLFALLVGIAGFSGNKAIMTVSATAMYYILAGWMLLSGILHVFILPLVFPWAIRKPVTTGLVMTLGSAFLGTAFLLLVINLSGISAFARIHMTSVLMFLIPFLLYTTYLFYLKIPVKVLRKWQYPVDRHIDDPTDREMDSPLVIGFEFRKKAEDEYMTSFRAKAPKEMVFGKLFYYFINDYNDRNPDEKIIYLDEENKPYSWIFYHKPGWFGSIRYIDPDETNSFNFIRENSVIVCKRVIEK